VEDFADVELRTKLLKQSKDLIRRGRIYESLGGALVFGTGATVLVSKIIAAPAIAIIGIGLLLSIQGAACLIEATITEKLLDLDQMQCLRRGETIGARITRDVRAY
jgi:hypothetical protein